jgi:hypothetical protein
VDELDDLPHSTAAIIDRKRQQATYRGNGSC